MIAGRMDKPCLRCPFNETGPGLVLRTSLQPGRWEGICEALDMGSDFHCHNTTDGEEDDDGEYISTGNELLCAGAVAYQEKQGVSSRYARIRRRVGM